MEAFRTGEGIGWHEHDEQVFTGCERFFQPGYLANLVPQWIPALDGVVAKLENGARVADLGCGHGASTMLLAQAYPNSSFHGSDYHQGSIDQARKRAAEAGVADRVTFEVASAQTFTGTATTWSRRSTACTTWATRWARPSTSAASLAPDGTWLIVEPAASDNVEDNLNPVGRVYYNFSTFLCVPNAHVADRRLRARRAGRRGGDPPGRDRRRLHPVPQGRRDARSTTCSRPVPNALPVARRGLGAASAHGSAAGRLEPAAGRRFEVAQHLPSGVGLDGRDGGAVALPGQVDDRSMRSAPSSTCCALGAELTGAAAAGGVARRCWSTSAATGSQRATSSWHQHSGGLAHLLVETELRVVQGQRGPRRVQRHVVHRPGALGSSTGAHRAAARRPSAPPRRRGSASSLKVAGPGRPPTSPGRGRTRRRPTAPSARSRPSA